MANKIVKQVVELVHEIYHLDNDISNFDRLRELSRDVWEENHRELLSELDKLDMESNIDFQLFWYECLGFPQVMPRYFYKSGKPAWVLYGFLPSKIHECEQYCRGFHDAKIMYVTYENDMLSLFLDGTYLKSDMEYELKLSFDGIVNILYRNNMKNDSYVTKESIVNLLTGNIISSAEEIPMINFVFDNLNLDKQFLLPEKRLFYIDIFDRNGDFEIYIIFDKWEYEKGCIE